MVLWNEILYLLYFSYTLTSIRHFIFYYIYQTFTYILFIYIYCICLFNYILRIFCASLLRIWRKVLQTWLIYEFARSSFILKQAATNFLWNPKSRRTHITFFFASINYINTGTFKIIAELRSTYTEIRDGKSKIRAAKEWDRSRETSQDKRDRMGLQS